MTGSDYAVIGLAALVAGAFVVALLHFARAYCQRLDTERAVSARITRLAAWSERADTWERWATVTGQSIPQEFLDERPAIGDEAPGGAR